MCSWKKRGACLKKKNIKRIKTIISRTFMVILEDFSHSHMQRTLGELPIFKIMTWHLCHLLRSALNYI